MFILAPYRTDEVETRFPGANWFFMAAILLVHLYLEVSGGPLPEAFVLHEWSLAGLFGYMFLHGGWLHLIGNLLFLWVFGNAVCSRVGNLAYLVVFPALGMLAGVAHLIFHDQAAIGASGAINGVVGVYLCFFPRSRISMFWLLLYRTGFFQVRSIWLILVWFVLDLLGALLGMAGVAYVAHLGGFLSGFVLGAFLAYTGLVKFHPLERPLFGAGSASPQARKELAYAERQEPEVRVEPVAKARPEPVVEALTPASPARPPPLPLKVPPVTPGGSPPKVESHTDGSVTLTCGCGREIRRDGKWRHTRILCPGCFSEIEPQEDGG